MAEVEALAQLTDGFMGNYYWGSRPLAFYTTTPDNDGYTLFWEHQDWEGTERARTDASSYANSSPDATFYSLPYGDAQAQVEDQDGVGDLDANHYGMLDSDMETGTDHAQFRQYSPATGRWMRPDPYAGSYDMSNPQSMNRYVYAMNSPLSGTDSSGLDDGACDEGGFCGIHFEGGITGYSVGEGGDNGSWSTYGGYDSLDYSVVTKTTTTYNYAVTVSGSNVTDVYIPIFGGAITTITMQYSSTSESWSPGYIVMSSGSSSYSWGSSGSSSGGGSGGSSGSSGAGGGTNNQTQQTQQQQPRPCSQIEQVSKAWHTVETVGSVGVGAGVMAAGAAGWVAACGSGNPLLCVAASEAAPAFIVGGYDVMKASWNELQNPNPSDFEGCQ